MNAKTKKIISGAFTVSAGGFIAKILGAVYRIPLTNLLGAEGIGLYQMVFPLYSALLTLSSTGIPGSISKIIAQGEESVYVLNKSKKLFGFIGGCGSALMCVCAYFIAKAQGAPEVGFSYVLLSPSVLIVTIISAYRGYFQGLSDMRPTAISQTIEQLVKLFFGLGFAYFFKDNLTVAVSSCVLAVTISEVVALIYLKQAYKLRGTEENSKTEKAVLSEAYYVNRLENTEITSKKTSRAITNKGLIKIVLPVTISALIIPISRMIDSFLTVNIISRYRTDAKALYGLYSGGVESVIGVPVAVCYGIAVALIPVVGKVFAGRQSLEIKKYAGQCVMLTAGASLLAGLAVSVFSLYVVKVLYYSLSASQQILTAKLISCASPTVFFLSVIQTQNAIFIACDKQRIPPIHLAIGVIVKVIVMLIALPMPKINIFALPISDILCYTVACFLNLVYYLSMSKKF